MKAAESPMVLTASELEFFACEERILINPRVRLAELKFTCEAIDELQRHVDILIVVSNDKLLEIVPEGVPLQEAFSFADEILRQGISGISDIVVKPGA